MDREAIINEIYERVMDEREMTLSEIIQAEQFDTYVPGRVDFLYVEEHFTSVVPCRGKVIIVRDRYDSAAHKHVAEYAVYNLTDKDTFGDPVNPNSEVICAESVYKFDHVCTQVFDNQALAVAHAVKTIYKTQTAESKVKYGIMVKNNGMWGFSTWCNRDGEPELYSTKEEAEAVAKKYNDKEGPVNRFNYYFVKEYIEED